MTRLDLLVSDTLIPDIFISDYLPNLDGDAVKVYILMCHLGQIGEAIETPLLASRLGMDVSSVQKAMVKLAGYRLLEVEGDASQARLLPLKEQEILKHYRPLTSKAPSEVDQNHASIEERQMMIRSISQSFFHDMMSAGWYTLIDTWFDEYQFTPEVVYALFQECERRGNLRTRAYAKKVAENWHEEGVRTALDLEKYWKDNSQFQGMTARVRQHMNRRDLLTRAEEEMVRRWTVEWGFDEAMIDAAFARATSASRPNLRYFDAILKHWYEAGVDTPAKIERFDLERERRREEEKELMKALGRRHLTAAESEIYWRWREELGYPHSMILTMLGELSKRSKQGVSMHYLDTVIQNYAREGLKTIEAIGQHELERRQGRSSYARGSQSRPSSTANFEQRDYDDAFVEAIYQHAWDAIAEQTPTNSDATGERSS